MNAHERRIFARKCKRHNITTETRWKWWGGTFWIPLIDGWHVEWDSPRGPEPVYLRSPMAALRYAINHAEQS